MTREYLLSLLRFDFEAGRVYWLNPPKNHPRLRGAEAGTPQAQTSRKKTYWVIRIDGKPYRRSRLMFLAAHGRFPTPCVDHANGNSLDDRLINLREASVVENARNHKTRARRIDLPMGVRLIPGSGRYQARIGFCGKQLHLGSYETPELARAAYQNKRRELFHEFA